MKKSITFMLLFAKRLLKKPSFVIILLLMPVMVLFLAKVIEKDTETIRAALYCEDGDARIEQVIDTLVDTDRTVSFYRVDSADEAKREVLTGHAECAFVFKTGLYQALLDDKAENMIVIYRSNKTTLDDMAKEFVFSDLYKAYGYDRLADFLVREKFWEKNPTPERTQAEEYLKKQFEMYMQEGGAFEVVYTDRGQEKTGTSDDLKNDRSYLLRPIRGILALFVMLAALAGAIFRALDEKEGVYATMSYDVKPFINMVVVFIPALLAGIVAILSLYLGGIGENPGMEILGMLVYVILLTGFANLLRAVFAKAVILCSILPMVTVISLIGCNIFFDVSVWVKSLKAIRYILPPHYFLEKVTDLAGLGLCLGLGIALLAAGFVTDRIKKAPSGA